MAELYWVLRVKGRNRWQETIATGEPPVKGAADLSALHDGAEVTIFRAVPYQQVKVDWLEKVPAPEDPAPSVGQFHAINNLGVHYTCGHSVQEAADGALIPRDCPVCPHTNALKRRNPEPETRNEP